MTRRGVDFQAGRNKSSQVLLRCRRDGIRCQRPSTTEGIGEYQVTFKQKQARKAKLAKALSKRASFCVNTICSKKAIYCE